MGAKWMPQDEVAHPAHPVSGPKLLLQKGFYRFDDGSADEHGVRFVGRLANGKLQARGPACVDGLADVDTLSALGRAKGW